MTALEALQKAPLFHEFTETGLKIFAAIALDKVVSAGTPLFVENMVGESLFIVKSGTVKLTHKTADGEKELAVVGAGEHLGELALLGKSVRLVSAVAATDCEVLEITQRDFARLQPQKPQACLKLALAIAQDLAQRVADNREAIRELATRKPAGA
ncbi:MAG TPA: cyclic nucleotide-binding domain-containing protein [Anaeromyxobacter sp.]